MADAEEQAGMTPQQGNDLAEFRASACALRDIVERARKTAETMGISINEIILSDDCDRAIAGMRGW